MSFNPYQTKNAVSVQDDDDSDNESENHDNDTQLSTNEELFQNYITKNIDEE